MTILLVSSRVDPHSIIIKRALEDCGVSLDILSPALIPSSRLYCSLDVDAEGLATRHRYQGNLGFNKDYSTVWLRRLAFPPLELIDDRDRGFAERELQHFLIGFFSQMCNETRCINDFWSAKFINNKINQLKLAIDLGFRVPKTLITTSPIEAKDRIREWRGAILKSLIPMFWETEDKQYALYATSINEDAIENNDEFVGVIQIQERIYKTSDVRVFVCGNNQISVEVNGDAHPETQIDFRAGFATGRLETREVNLPTDISAKIYKFMEMANIETASFDFVVVDAEYYFLECNESGNFLWMEEFCPSLKALSLICKKLTEREDLSEEQQKRIDNLKLSAYIDFDESELEGDDSGEKLVLTPRNFQKSRGTSYLLD